MSKKDLLNQKLEYSEGMLCGLILKQPSLLNEYVINKNNLSVDGVFYISMVERLFQKGIEFIDEVTFSSEVESIENLEKEYSTRGGFKTVKNLMELVNIKNQSSIFDEWSKWNTVRAYSEKGILNLDILWDKIVKMTSSDIYSFIEHESNSVPFSTGIDDLIFEDLVLTDEEIEELMNGADLGLQFGSKSPILNYLTMGLPKSELNAICGYINEGKTSFAFSNFVMGTVEEGTKALIISTEQRSKNFKLLLTIYILTNKLKYYKITRKKLKAGAYTTEDLAMINKAKDYAREHYADNIVFLKLYDYNTDKVTKAIKKYAQRGFELMLYDVLKFGDNADQIWKSLIEDSKNLFQCCSKYNIAGLVTLQLAMSTKNKVRQVGMECVANAKQVFEVMSEAIFIRTAWQDELDETSTTYLKPYRLKNDANGKFTSEKDYLTLDKEKTYKIVRLGKSRNDSTDKFILYLVDFNYNVWKELGYCTVSDKNNF